VGADQRFVFQGVHMLADSAWGKAWQRNEARVSRLVFIGRGLDAAALKSGFAACAA
jgi:G3E family GTPase